MAFYIDNEKVMQCPLSSIKSESLEFLNAYNLYRIGILPNGKGWLEESKKFLQAMKVIDNTMQEQEKKSIDKNKHKRNK